MQVSNVSESEECGKKRYEQAQFAEMQQWQNSVKSFDGEKALREFESLGINPSAVTGKLLDIGGGYGHYASLFTSASERIVVDPLYDKFGIEINGITGISCGGEKLPFPSGYFDFVIIRNVIDHMLEPAGLLKEAARVQKPSGSAFFMVNTFLTSLKPAFPLLNVIDGPHPLHFSINDVRAIIKSTGFRIEKERINSSSGFEPRLKRIIGMLIKREYYAVLRCG